MMRFTKPQQRTTSHTNATTTMSTIGNNEVVKVDHYDDSNSNKDHRISTNLTSRLSSPVPFQQQYSSPTSSVSKKNHNNGKKNIETGPCKSSTISSTNNVRHVPSVKELNYDPNDIIFVGNNHHHHNRHTIKNSKRNSSSSWLSLIRQRKQYIFLFCFIFVMTFVGNNILGSFRHNTNHNNHISHHQNRRIISSGTISTKIEPSNKKHQSKQQRQSLRNLNNNNQFHTKNDSHQEKQYTDNDKSLLSITKWDNIKIFLPTHCFYWLYNIFIQIPYQYYLNYLNLNENDGNSANTIMISGDSTDNNYHQDMNDEESFLLSILSPNSNPSSLLLLKKDDNSKVHNSNSNNNNINIQINPAMNENNNLGKDSVLNTGLEKSIISSETTTLQTGEDNNNKFTGASNTHSNIDYLVKPNDFIYKRDGEWDSVPIVLEEYKLIFFSTAKVGCTVWKTLFRRMMKYSDWNSQNHTNMIPWNPKTNGLKYLYDYSIKDASYMIQSSDWIKAIFVRDPKERFVSAFLDKGVSNPSYLYAHCCIPSYMPSKYNNWTVPSSSNEYNEKQHLDSVVSNFRQQYNNETSEQKFIRQKNALTKYWNPKYLLVQHNSSSNHLSSTLSNQYNPTYHTIYEKRGGGRQKKEDAASVVVKQQRQTTNTYDEECVNRNDIKMAKVDVQIFFRRIVTQCKNSHWKKQSLRIEEKYWQYINFVGHMETITNDAAQLLKLIGAWDDYGSNGWNDYDGRIFAPKQSMGRKHQTNASEKLQQYITSVEFENDLETFYSNDYRNPILNLPLKRIFPEIDHERYHHNKEENNSMSLSSVSTTTSSTINYNSVNDDRSEHSTKTETNEINSEITQDPNQDENKNTKNVEDETSSEEDDLSKLMDGNDITLPYDEEFQSTITTTTFTDDNRSSVIHDMNNKFSDDNNRNNDMIIQQQRMQQRHEESIDSEDNRVRVRVRVEQQQDESDDNTIAQSISNENDKITMNQEVTNQDSYQDIDTEGTIGNNNNDEVDVEYEDDENNAVDIAAKLSSKEFIDAD